MAARKARRRTQAAPPARSLKKKTPTPRKRASTRTSVTARQPERRHSKRETLRLRSIEPSFTVGDLERSVRFYTDVLGFVVSERFTDAAGVLRGVSLKAGVCQLGLSQDDWAKGRDRQRGVAVRIWCTTAQDIDALAVKVTAGGGRITQGPADETWGGRSLSVDDPDGFHLTIYRP
jgi:catechol 2,3-dioxygenase-like lactoylglutathione lyase family enzyme